MATLCDESVLVGWNGLATFVVVPWCRESRTGIAIIRPPQTWRERRKGPSREALDAIKIDAPTLQVHTVKSLFGTSGVL